MLKTKNSDKWQFRANQRIAQGALTNSKRPECFSVYHPTHVTKGRGALLWDPEGNRYVDMICGLGANILGYANQGQNNAIVEILSSGITLSFSTPLELELADELNQIFSFAESFKFLKTGSEGCIASLRIARAFTGRKKVLSHGYHGWTDEFVSLTPPALGVPEYKNIELLHNDFSNITEEVAAVIVEPVLLDSSDDRVKWLKELRKITAQHGVLLIFDEVITGFRFKKWCVANHIGVNPDLIILGKAISNGLPLSIVGGSHRLMNCGEYFVSSTHAGERLSIASAISTIKQLKKLDLNAFLDKVNFFLSKLSPHLKECGIEIQGYGSRGALVGTDMQKALFMQEAARACLLFGPSVFFSFAHIEHFEHIFETIVDLKRVIKSAALEGPLPKKPFAQRSRES